MSINKVFKILAINVVVSLILFEIVLRIFPQLLPSSTVSPMMVSHPYLSLWFKPSLKTKYINSCYESDVYFNEMGLRALPMKELKNKKEAWVFVGDSMVQGFQVDNEELFTGLIQKQFSDVAVFNLGKAGSSPIYYNKVLKHFLEREHLHPNVKKIFFFVFMGNDFQNVLETRENTWYKDFAKKYLYKFRILAAARVIYYRSLWYTTQEEINRHKQADEKSGLPFWAYDNEAFSHSLEKLEKVLLNLKNFSEENNIQAIIVPIPDIHQMEGGIENPLYFHPVNSLKTLANKLELTFYDLAGDLISELRNKNLPHTALFPECDGHYNQLGHEWISGFLVEKVISKH